MSKNLKIFIFVIIVSFFSSLSYSETKTTSRKNYLVKIFSFYQSYNYYYPWEKNKFYKRTSYGVLLKNNYILTTADTITDNTYIELKKTSSEKKYKAKVVYYDYDCNIAVLKANDQSFYEGLTPIDIEKPLKKGDQVFVVQIKSNNDLLKTNATIDKIFIDESFLSWNEFISYKISVKLENRDDWAEPIIHNGKLAGILTTYNTNKFTAVVIPSEIIEHFIKDIEDGKYDGFPNSGFLWEKIDNPYLKDYLGMKDNKTGIYITEVAQKGPAAKILKEGDVILSIDNYDIDDNGYIKHTVYGKILFNYLISSKFPGDEISLKILRNKKEKEVKIKAKRFTSNDYFIPLYSFDKQAKYIIEGGMIFQEVTVKYLKSWGDDWENVGNLKLLYYYNYNIFNPPDDRERIVVVSYVLPDDINIGYQDIKTQIVKEINGRKIKNIEDVADIFDTTNEKYIKITFDDGREAVFKTSDLKTANQRIKQRYRIKKYRNL